MRGQLQGPTEWAPQEGGELTVEALAVLVVAMRGARPLLDEAHDQPEREAGERTRKGERRARVAGGRALALRRCWCSRGRGESWQLWKVSSRGRQGDGDAQRLAPLLLVAPLSLLDYSTTMALRSRTSARNGQATGEDKLAQAAVKTPSSASGSSSRVDRGRWRSG